MQRDQARRVREAQQQQRAAERAVASAQRAEEARRREVARQAAANERERKRLYVEGRKAEAATLTDEVEQRVSELRSVLATRLASPVGVSFGSLKRQADRPRFDPGGLDKPAPAPDWADHVPRAPSVIARVFGGAERTAGR